MDWRNWNLPMDAGRGDAIIGTTEDGRPIYRSQLGTQYWQAPRAPKPKPEVASLLPAYGGQYETSKTAPAWAGSQPGLGDLGGVLGGVLGAVMSGVSAPGRALRGQPVTKGDVINAALDWGLLSAPMSAPRGALRAGGMVDDAPKGIKAYHGSPHDFDQFDMSNIGTGEGAQAYGHGLYFAEAEDVAKAYRDALAPGMGDGALRAVGVSDGDLRSMRQFTQSSVDPDVALRDWLGWTGKRETPELRDAFMREWNGRNQGRMYEVNINANPDDFLDWDAPLSEQPQVLDRLRNYGGQYRDEVANLKAERDALAAQAPAPSMTNDFDALFADDGFGEGWARLGELDAKIREAEAAAAKASKQGALFSDSLNEDFLTSTWGRNLATASGDSYSLTGAADNVQLSQQLREAGIPGIKYLDAGSRGAGTGSRNYVVFDDKLITILRKYGLLPALLGGSGIFNQQQPQG